MTLEFAGKLLPDTVYVGRLPCGCVTAIRFVLGYADLKQFEKMMAKYGATVEILPLKEANAQLKVCLHNLSNNDKPISKET